MKTLIAIVAMVLLSGVAWGQNYFEQECSDKCRQIYMNIESGTTVQFLNCVDKCLRSVRDRTQLKFKADDPTAWKQTDSKYGAEDGWMDQFCEKKCTVDHGGGWKTVYTLCKQECLDEQRKKPPWADSRYRLEKNELQNPVLAPNYRITENFCGTWKEVWNGWVITNEVYRTGHIASESEAIEMLNKFKENERKDKAWRPIK